MSALKLRTVMKKRKKWRLEVFIVGTENDGDISRPNIGEKIWTIGLERHCWMTGA